MKKVVIFLASTLFFVSLQCEEISTQSSTQSLLSENEKIALWQKTCRSATEAAHLKHANQHFIRSLFVGSLVTAGIVGLTRFLDDHFSHIGQPCATCHQTAYKANLNLVLGAPALVAGILAAFHTISSNGQKYERSIAFVENIVHSYTTHPEDLPEIVAEPMQQLIDYYQKRQKMAPNLASIAYLAITAFSDI